jgi:hypothetical protein
MWVLDNKTPFAAERTWVRDKDGAHHWVVIVKATYDITDEGRLSMSAKQVPPLYMPEYNGTVGESSLRYEADLVAMKPGTDVYLNAIAYAPAGKSCEKIDVSFQIDGLKKKLLVFGNRTWRRTLIGRLGISRPEPFQTMPITYERAFGGFDQEHPNSQKHRIDFRNPVGTGVVIRNQHLIGKPAPNIERPARKIGKDWPAGFGAVASYWSPRKEFAGTYDQKWESKRKPLLPLDYDPKWLLCSPLDQQIPAYLNGGEQVELTNLTPKGRLTFGIPKQTLSFKTHFGATRKEHYARLVTAVFESEGPRLILVWQTSLQCGNNADYLDKTVISQIDASH